ncbi:MAG: 2-oxoacid:acceptor oxidoreductase family protein [Deltaproteobacteria bacterium]|nr:2-oxoacid:acceptor oxidoreductase family protein [Deltaproteobacteria bacterium]
MEGIAKKFSSLLEDAALEIRADGKAGSGVVLVMQSLASMAIADKSLHVQEWPFFSSARRGAPIRGYLRISRRPLEQSSPITEPQISVMMDEGVARAVDFAVGVPPDGIYVLNTTLSPEEAAKKYKLTGRVYTIDGNALGEHYLKKPLGNISVLALLTAIIPLFKPEEAMQKFVGVLKKRRLPDAVIDANMNLFEASLGKSAFADVACAGTDDHSLAGFAGYGELMPGAQSRLRLSRTNLTSAYARTGFRLHFEDPNNLCNGCGHCITNCPENIIQFIPDPTNGVRVTGAEIASYCKLCRECIEVCPKELFSEAPLQESM